MHGCYEVYENAVAYQLETDVWFSYVVEKEAQRVADAAHASSTSAARDSPAQDDSLYCLVPYSAVDWTFAVGTAILLSVAVAVIIVSVFIFFRRRWRNHCGSGKDPVGDAYLMAEYARDPPAITAIVPCYLPNEKDIIEDTICWIMHELQSPASLDVMVVYNTPTDMPELEQRLREMETAAWPSDRTFRIHRVWDSKSKAANLNSALQMITTPYVAIYDADHWPERESLLRLYGQLAALDLDCVQGSWFIRNKSQNQCGCRFPFLARIIDAEFFVDNFFSKQVLRTFFLGSGFFGGSNALWRKDALASKEFDTTAQTEDVDMSVRQLMAGRKIDFCPESRSGELAPVSLAALWKQRFRWCAGWDEVTLKSGCGAKFVSAEGGCRVRIGMIWVFGIRWLLPFLSLCPMYVTLPVLWYKPMDDAHRGRMLVLMCQVLFKIGLLQWALAVLESLCTVVRSPCSGIDGEALARVPLVAFIASPVGMFLFFWFNTMVQIASWGSLLFGASVAWEVTERAPTPTHRHGTPTQMHGHQSINSSTGGTAGPAAQEPQPMEAYPGEVEMTQMMRPLYMPQQQQQRLEFA